MLKKRQFAPLIAVLVMLNGCDNVSTEDDPGSIAALCQNIFDSCISPILQGPIGASSVSCANSSCHTSTGTGGAFILIQNPATASDLAFNFNSAQAFVNVASPSQSELLAEPLVGDAGVASIGPHGGGDIFNTTAAACYQELLQWASTPDGSCPTDCTQFSNTPPTPAELNSCAP